MVGDPIEETFVVSGLVKGGCDLLKVGFDGPEHLGTSALRGVERRHAGSMSGASRRAARLAGASREHAGADFEPRVLDDGQERLIRFVGGFEKGAGHPRQIRSQGETLGHVDAAPDSPGSNQGYLRKFGVDLPHGGCRGNSPIDEGPGKLCLPIVLGTVHLNLRPGCAPGTGHVNARHAGAHQSAGDTSRYPPSDLLGQNRDLQAPTDGFDLG